MLSPHPMRWLSHASEAEKRRLIEEKWPGVLNGRARPLHQYWWYKLPFSDERTEADMRSVAAACFPQSLGRFKEIEKRVSREAHYEYSDRGRCFLVVRDPDIGALSLRLRDKYCPLYAVVIGESRVGVEDAPPDNTPDYLNFYKIGGQPRVQLAVHRGSGGIEIGPAVSGMTMVAPAEGEHGPSSYTQLGEMRPDHRQPPPARLATADVAPLRTDDPLMRQKVTPQETDPFRDEAPTSFTWSERVFMLCCVLFSLAVCGFLASLVL